MCKRTRRALRARQIQNSAAETTGLKPVTPKLAALKSMALKTTALRARQDTLLGQDLAPEFDGSWAEIQLFLEALNPEYRELFDHKSYEQCLECLTSDDYWQRVSDRVGVIRAADAVLSHEPPYEHVSARAPSFRATLLTTPPQSYGPIPQVKSLDEAATAWEQNLAAIKLRLSK